MYNKVNISEHTSRIGITAFLTMYGVCPKIAAAMAELSPDGCFEIKSEKAKQLRREPLSASEAVDIVLTELGDKENINFEFLRKLSKKCYPEKQ